MTDGEDLTKWQRKRVGLTTSAELVNLERDIPYAIRVAARTKVLTFMVHAENSSNCPAISFFRSFSLSPFQFKSYARFITYFGHLVLGMKLPKSPVQCLLIFIESIFSTVLSF